MTREVRYRAKNFSVCVDTFRYDSTGVTRQIEFVDQPPVAIAIPILKSGNVVLVEQWRPLLGKTILECPGGKVDPGETVEEAVRRELSEEIGMVPAQLEKLGDFFSSVGSSTERIHCFVASQMSSTHRSLSDAKKMNIKEFTTKELQQRLRDGILPDGKTHIALSTFLAGWSHSG